MGLVLGQGDSNGILAGVSDSSGSAVLRDRDDNFPTHMVLPPEAVDVLPTPLADPQAQGGTPAAATSVEEDSMVGLSEVHEASSGTLGEWSPSPGSRVRGLICSYPWPQGCDYWIGIAWCESTLGQDPDAYSDWTDFVGLFQIWMGHGYSREWLKDDANNVQAAWELSHEGTYTGAWWYCQRQ